jgi:Gly-Xaa carboxypeptidase
MQPEKESRQLPSPTTVDLLKLSKDAQSTSDLSRAPGSTVNTTWRRCLLVAVCILLTSTSYYVMFKLPPWGGYTGPVSPAEDCAQYAPLAPPPDDALDAQLAYLASSPHFRNHTAHLLSGAVQVRSESFDDLGEVGQDPRWDVFARFHDYLERSFPNVHKTLHKETVNKFGLLYTWKGTDESLKPLLAMAHQVNLARNPEETRSYVCVGARTRSLYPTRP